MPIITKWGETLKKEWENLNIQSNDMKCGEGFQNLLDRIEKHDGNIEQQAQTAFENYLGDCFAIYQIKLDRELYAKFAFQSYATITADGHSPIFSIFSTWSSLLTIVDIAYQSAMLLQLKRTVRLPTTIVTASALR